MLNIAVHGFTGVAIKVTFPVQLLYLIGLPPQRQPEKVTKIMNIYYPNKT